MKKNKGFTLIEMLVVIAVIAVLSVTFGLSANKVAKETRYSKCANTMKELFSSARIYSNLTVVPDGCPSCNDNQSCNISIECLVKKGLLDEKIYNTYNPLVENTKFLDADVLHVTYEQHDEKYTKHVTFNDNTNLTEDNLYTYDWGDNCK